MSNNKESTRYYSDLQEKYLEKKFNAKRQSNSGAGKFAKGDLIIDEASMLLEAKTCMSEKTSFSIKRDWLEKNVSEAKAQRLFNSVLCFNFGPNTENHYVIDEKLMKFLVESLKMEYTST